MGKLETLPAEFIVLNLRQRDLVKNIHLYPGHLWQGGQDGLFAESFTVLLELCDGCPNGGLFVKGTSGDVGDIRRGEAGSEMALSLRSKIGIEIGWAVEEGSYFETFIPKHAPCSSWRNGGNSFWKSLTI
jgi:hypothetical protein